MTTMTQKKKNAFPFFNFKYGELLHAKSKKPNRKKDRSLRRRRPTYNYMESGWGKGWLGKRSDGAPIKRLSHGPI